MIDLTAFQQLILLTVAIRERQHDESPHGLGIRDDLTEMYRGANHLDTDEEVNHGRLYPNLDKLVDRSLLEKGTVDDRTNEYRLTEKGKKAIRMLHELTGIADGQEGTNPYAPRRHLLNPPEKIPETAD